jgi:hypothetical protein
MRLSGGSLERPTCLSLAKLTVVVEPVEGDFSILADLDEVAVRITHVAAPFPAVEILQRLRKKDRAFVAPLFVALPICRRPAN